MTNLGQTVNNELVVIQMFRLLAQFPQYWER